MSFELYPEETSTLRFRDYAIILEQAKGAKSALEFGPGHSTLALIEAGVPKIVSCEHDPAWFEAAKEKFKGFKQVRIIPYKNEPEAKAKLTGQFDIAFVDSPKGNQGARTIHEGQEDCSRLNTCLLALRHSPVVLLHDCYRPLERATLDRLNAMGHRVSFIEDSAYGIARIERCD